MSAAPPIMAALATMALGLLARGDVGDDGEFTLPFDDQIKCSQVVEGPRSVCEPQNNTFEGSTHSRRTTDEAATDPTTSKSR